MQSCSPGHDSLELLCRSWRLHAAVGLLCAGCKPGTNPGPRAGLPVVDSPRRRGPRWRCLIFFVTSILVNLIVAVSFLQAQPTGLRAIVRLLEKGTPDRFLYLQGAMHLGPNRERRYSHASSLTPALSKQLLGTTTALLRTRSQALPGTAWVDAFCVRCTGCRTFAQACHCRAEERAGKCDCRMGVSRNPVPLRPTKGGDQSQPKSLARLQPAVCRLKGGVYRLKVAPCLLGSVAHAVTRATAIAHDLTCLPFYPSMSI